MIITYLCFFPDRVQYTGFCRSGNKSSHSFWTWDGDPYPYLYWYQHKTNGFPVYMLRKLSTGSSSSEKDFEERFHADLNKSSSSVSLTIRDACVWLCCLLLCSAAHCDWNTSWQKLRALKHTVLTWVCFSLLLQNETLQQCVEFIHTDESVRQSQTVV